MFCFQCEQTAGCSGCTGCAGVCGKSAKTAALQDELTGALIGLVHACSNQGKTKETDKILIEGLFTTITNVNFNDETLQQMIEKSKRMPLADARDHFIAVASRSHLTPETETYIADLKKKHGNVELISSGSSIKICLVAEGKADVYPRFAPTMEWDTAAGHAIARAAGMEVYQAGKEEPLRYNKEDLLNPWFIVEAKRER